jgi:hypothetical protein
MSAEQYANSYLKDEVKIIESSERQIIVPDLNIFEKALIYKYSEDGYQDLNEQLRSSNGENISKFGQLLYESIEKLPNFIGNVYRSINLNDIEYNKYLTAFQNDEIIIEPFFISTSRSQLIGNQFGRIRFEIFCQRGKNIESISKYASEKEVLINYNSQFRVIEVNEIKKHIKLIEI